MSETKQETTPPGAANGGCALAITPQELLHRIGTHEAIVVIDVRSPAEYASVHAEGAVNVPLDALNPQSLRQQYPDDLIACICKSGKRGGQALDKLRAAGISDSANVVGGTDAWVASGFPVVRDSSVMSIERQVRIGVGAIVLIGLALGFFVHPALYLISAFVGCGLVFAGVTDWCCMGLLLTKMPWNHRAPKGSGGGASCGI